MGGLGGGDRPLPSEAAPMSVADAEALQRKFSTRRKRWARHVGVPVVGDLETPDPGELDVQDPELG